MAQTKEKAQIRHAKMRASERYGLNLSDHEYFNLCNIIRKGGARIVDKQSNRVSIHELSWKNIDMTVVYDKLRGTIVSFLPNSDRFDSVEF
ncbi:hypothetical protein LDC_0880 [sediment metagenome]|uniref:Uncharacterized protein n=1 Tax=sediment metagenome TaxID=749907 RepID=D9PH80_9ZZZZ